jgi:hypothetical protein
MWTSTRPSSSSSSSSSSRVGSCQTQPLLAVTAAVAVAQAAAWHQPQRASGRCFTGHTRGHASSRNEGGNGTHSSTSSWPCAHCHLFGCRDCLACDGDLPADSWPATQCLEGTCFHPSSLAKPCCTMPGGHDREVHVQAMPVPACWSFAR